MWGQLQLANVPVERWIIDPNVYHLLDCCCNVMHLPTHNGECVYPGMMTYGVAGS